MSVLEGASLKMIDLKSLKPEIERVCQEMPIKRLGIFGSALTDDFSEKSDVDILVLFDSKPDIDSFNLYFSLKERLEKIFRRTVDLVVEKRFRNPYFQHSVDSTKKVIYER